jgi:hypothetical protein
MAELKRDKRGRFTASGNGRRKVPSADFMALASALSMRASVGARLGKSYPSASSATFNRDIYEALGYNKTPSFNDYMAKYQRQDVARAIIDAPVRACWRKPPAVVETQEADETLFEAAWDELCDRLGMWRLFARADRLAGIGTYAVLFLGFDDSGNLETEVTGAKSLLYAAPYSQANAKIESYEDDTASPRYGKAASYKLNVKGAGGTSTTGKVVHWSRIVHVAEDMLEDEVEGQPKLQPVLNRLQDLDLVVGGSAEMFWRGAFPGYLFKADDGATFDGQTLAALEDELEEFMHDLKRYIRGQNIDVKALAQQIADPSSQASVFLDLISAATRIPKRILLGSERGELASSMDEKNWLDVVQARQREHCEPTIVRATVDRLIAAGVLQEPKRGYSVVWPDLHVPGDKDRAEVGAVVAKALRDYVDANGAEMVVPPESFVRKLPFTDEEIEQIVAQLQEMGRELGEGAADAEAVAEQQEEEE